MYKLQLQLIPPSALSTPMQGNASQHLFNNSQISANMSGISLNHFPSNLMFRRDNGMYYHPSRRNMPVSAIPRVNSNIKRVLHFTKKTGTLQQLSNEIIEKIEKMYPDVETEIEIDTLQDKWGCDLDPDFTVNEVFATDNVVQVLLKNDIDWNQHVPVSGYANKRMKLSKREPSGTQFVTTGNNHNQCQMHPPSINVTGVPPHNENEQSVISIPKRGVPQSSNVGRYKGIRVSTPLIHQIHPTNSMIDDNDGEGNHTVDLRNKSVLPPPSQPQYPPIRISSGMEVGKQIKSSVGDDTVSRSETVDPVKAKQQRLQFNSPHLPITTPNKIGLTRKNSYHEPGKEGDANDEGNIDGKISNAKNSSVRRHQSLQTPKVDQLNIQHEIRKNNEMQSGSTPLPNGSTFKNKIPVSAVRTLYSHQAPIINAASIASPNIDDVISISQDQESNSSRSIPNNPRSPARMLKRQQSSIADNNGSPVKNNPVFHEEDDQVHLAALPDSVHSAHLPGKKPLAGFLQETERISKVINPNINKHNYSSKKNRSTNNIKNSSEKDSESQESIANSSFHKKHLMAAIHSKSSRIPGFLKEESSKGHKKHSKSKKPYTTVLHKDIDNSKPDPRNILPKRMPRNAARKAVQKLSGNAGTDSEKESESDRDTNNDTMSTPSTDSGSEEMNALETDTGIETDYFSEYSSSDSSENFDEVPEPQMIINVDPIKEKMVTDFDTQVLSSQNDIMNKEPEKQLQTVDVLPILNEINTVIPDSQGTVNSHQNAGSSALLNTSAYRDSNSLGKENHSLTTYTGSHVPNVNNTQFSSISRSGNFQSNTPKPIDTNSNRQQSRNPKYPLKYLGNQIPKTRPSLQTIMDVKEKDFQLTKPSNTTYIPLDQETSTDDETSSDSV